MCDFEKAKEYYTEALDVCDSPQDNVMVYDCIADYYGLRGQIQNQIKALNLKYSELLKYQIPINVFIRRSVEIHNYVSAGDTVIALRILQELNEEIIPPYNRLTDIGHLNVYRSTKDTARIRETIPRAEEAIEILNFEIFRPLILSAEGLIEEKKGDYEKAIEFYERSLEANPNRVGVHVDIGRCYRMLGKFNKARERIQLRLDRNPYNPEANYEMGIVYYEDGEIEEATEYIKKALNVLEEADSGFELHAKVTKIYEILQKEKVNI
jgi:tetratricopeptide (TPR) repeat protein